MKKIASLLAALIAAHMAPAAVAAENDRAVPTAGAKTLRSDPAARPDARAATKRLKPIEKETVPFLGVETSPVSATLTAQLDLPSGSGLVVHIVVPDSPAAGVLRPHDILLKFDDQILIEQRQLAVLLRQRKEGDEVTLTFVRAGKRESAKVKLVLHEVPKLTGSFDVPWPAGDTFGFALSGGTDRAEHAWTPAAPRSADEVDHLLRLIQRGPGAPDVPPGMIPPPATRIFIDRGDAPGFRATSVNPGNSNLVFSDDEGSLELTIKEGRKTLVAKNAKGEQLFSGAVTTPEERAAVPAEIRSRLEQLEGMHDVTFKTDADFRGAETKTIRPLGRPILWHRAPRPVGHDLPASL